MTAHPITRRVERRQSARVLVVLLLALASVIAIASPANARAAHGPGLASVTLNGFTHQPLGAYITDVGRAFCIESGAYYPGDFHYAIGDLPAARGVSLNDRRGLAYILWESGHTNDNLDAAAVATVVYGLSGDAYASTNVPSMSVSNASVKAKAVEMYNRSMSRSFWLAGPWTLNTEMRHEGGDGWTSIIRVRNADGRPIVGKQITVTPYNVTSGPGSARTATTDANGNVVSSWTQVDPHQPITVDSRTTAPAYYTVWRASAQHQAVITPNGTSYSGRGQAIRVQEKGSGRVRKSTTNPDYQDAIGATFTVQPAGGGASLGTLTVGAGGYTNSLDLAPGEYQLVETSTPAGVILDPTPHRFTVVEDELTTVDLVNDVEQPGKINLLKVDQATGDPVAGAVLNVKFDSDANGSYETDKGTFTTGTVPTSVGSLLVGNYQVTEVSPPKGYLRPEVAQQFVTLTMQSTTIAVTFKNHLVPTISTYSQAQNTGTVDGDITVPFGAPIHDVAVVNGLADGEKATIDVNLYGPFESQEALAQACTAENVAWSGSYAITGSGYHPSPEFTPTKPGIYGYVETLKVPGAGDYSGECGTTSETVTVHTPELATQAQVPVTRPGAPVTDMATVTNLDPTVTDVTVETSLYGPFENADALAKACETGALGEPVGTVTDGIVGSGNHESSPINIPSENFAGIYTFLETLLVPGLPPITHECGTPPETFTVPGAPSITTKAQAPVLKPGESVADLAIVSGLALNDGEAATVETSLYGPFEDADALAKACKTGDLGKPVGTVNHEVTEDGETLSPMMKIPTHDYAGIYTFQAVLTAPGYQPVSHECGLAAESFKVTKVTDGSGGGGSTTGTGITQALPRTGAAIAAMATFGLLIVGIGGVLLIGARRRRDEADLY